MQEMIAFTHGGALGGVFFWFCFMFMIVSRRLLGILLAMEILVLIVVVLLAGLG